MEILRKLTIKSCGDFSVKRIKEVMEAAKLEENQTVPLLKIAGQSTGAKTGQTDKGEYTKLLGMFIGTDLTTGALYQSQQAILPEFVGGALGAALKSGSQTVEFAFEIHAKRKDTAVTGYEFVVKPLMNAEPTDAIKRIAAFAGIDTSKAPAALPPAAPPASAGDATPPTAAPAPAPADPAPAAAAAAKGKGK